MKPRRILHIEEDRHYVESLKRFLSKAGFQVERHGRGDTGVEAAREDPPQAILLAIRLPKKDGFQVLQELKSDPRTRAIPIIMLSDLSSREEIERCLKTGACAYVIKAHGHPKDIVACLDRAVEHPSGFTLIEWALVVALFLLALPLAWMQVNHYQSAERDVQRLARARSLAATWRAAAADQRVLVGCKSGDALTACRLCREASCRQETSSSSLVSFVDPGGRWTVEQEGDLPLSLDHFLVRFFLERESEGLAGGQTHTINAAGVVE